MKEKGLIYLANWSLVVKNGLENTTFVVHNVKTPYMPIPELKTNADLLAEVVKASKRAKSHFVMNGSTNLPKVTDINFTTPIDANFIGHANTKMENDPG